MQAETPVGLYALNEIRANVGTDVLAGEGLQPSQQGQLRIGRKRDINGRAAEGVGDGLRYSQLCLYLVAFDEKFLAEGSVVVDRRVAVNIAPIRSDRRTDFPTAERSSQSEIDAVIQVASLAGWAVDVSLEAKSKIILVTAVSASALSPTRKISVSSASLD